MPYLHTPLVHALYLLDNYTNSIVKEYRNFIKG